MTQASSAMLRTEPQRRVWPRLRQHLSVAAHPEALPLLLSALAWTVLIAGHERATPWGLLCAPARPTSGLADLGLEFVPHELVMLAAMMLPLVLFQVRHVVTRSYPERQLRGAVAFLVGYLAAWLVVALPFAASGLLLGSAPPASRRGLMLVFFAVAVLWQLSHRKAELLRQCVRTAPLRQDGWRADGACLAYGVVTARDCMAACWAPMLAALVRPHDLVTMAIVQIVATSERVRLVQHPRLAAAALIAAGVLALGPD